MTPAEDHAAMVKKVARGIAARKMRLSNKGEKLPDDLWQQAAPNVTLLLLVCKAICSRARECQCDNKRNCESFRWVDEAKAAMDTIEKYNKRDIAKERKKGTNKHA